jgi:peptide/nickel transport system ATP-binding protein
LLFISHNARVIEHGSDRVLVQFRGRLVEQGGPDAVFAAPKHDFTRRLLAALSAVRAEAAA